MTLCRGQTLRLWPTGLNDQIVHKIVKLAPSWAAAMVILLTHWCISSSNNISVTGDTLCFYFWYLKYIFLLILLYFYLHLRILIKKKIHIFIGNGVLLSCSTTTFTFPPTAVSWQVRHLQQSRKREGPQGQNLRRVRRTSSRRSAYAFSHQQGYGELITSGKNMRASAVSSARSPGRTPHSSNWIENMLKRKNEVSCISDESGDRAKNRLPSGSTEPELHWQILYSLQDTKHKGWVPSIWGCLYSNPTTQTYLIFFLLVWIMWAEC